MRNRMRLWAAMASLLAGFLFVASPGSDDRSWRVFVGLVWLLTGTVWLLVYRRGRHDTAS